MEYELPTTAAKTKPNDAPLHGRLAQSVRANNASVVGSTHTLANHILLPYEYVPTKLLHPKQIRIVRKQKWWLNLSHFLDYLSNIFASTKNNMACFCAYCCIINTVECVINVFNHRYKQLAINDVICIYIACCNTGIIGNDVINVTSVALILLSRVSQALASV